MSKSQNILQFEFFHVGGPKVNSIEEVFAECEERTLDSLELVMHGHDVGTGIKTVIRIYDNNGEMTALAEKIKRLEAESDRLSEMPIRPFGCSAIIGWRIRRSMHKSKKLKEKLFSYAVDYLDRAFSEPLRVAVERSDFSFKEVERVELLELTQSAKSAKKFWLFIFEPNNLIAGKNEIVVSVM